MHYKNDSVEKILFIYPMHKESNVIERWRGICRLFERVFKRYEMYLTYLHTRVHITLHTLLSFVYIFGSYMLRPDNRSFETQTQI